MATYIVTLQVTDDECGIHPQNWFWTDACPPGPDGYGADDVTILSVTDPDGNHSEPEEES